MSTRRRVQNPKRKHAKVIKSGNPDYVRGIQALRRSNASGPHKLLTGYVRKDKRNNKLGELDS